MRTAADFRAGMLSFDLPIREFCPRCCAAHARMRLLLSCSAAAAFVVRAKLWQRESRLILCPHDDRENPAAMSWDDDRLPTLVDTLPLHRIARLREFAVALSLARSPEDVARAAVEQGAAAFGADISLFARPLDERRMELLAERGLAPNFGEAHLRRRYRRTAGPGPKNWRASVRRINRRVRSQVPRYRTHRRCARCSRYPAADNWNPRDRCARIPLRRRKKVRWRRARADAHARIASSTGVRSRNAIRIGKSHQPSHARPRQPGGRTGRRDIDR